MAGAVAALGLTAYAHVAAAGPVDPAGDPVVGHTPLDARVWAMTGGTIMLAMACLWVAYGLARVDPTRSAAARVLSVAGALGLLLTAVFPAGAAPGPTPAGGEIHSWSAAVVFTALPCAGWMLGRRFRSPALSALSVLSVALLAVFLTTRPGSPVADLIGGSDYHGLVERLLLPAGAALVFLAARSTGTLPGSNKGDISRLPTPALPTLT